MPTPIVGPNPILGQGESASTAELEDVLDREFALISDPTLALRPPTLKEYHRQSQLYAEFCRQYHIPPTAPIQEKHLCAYLSIRARTHSVFTIRSTVSALASWHITKFKVPLPRSHLLRQTLRNLRQLYAARDTPTQSSVLEPHDLLRIRASLPSSYQSFSLWTCCLLLFWGIFRIGEILFKKQPADSPSPQLPALTWGQLTFCSRGVTVTLSRDKTHNHPVKICIASRPQDVFLCLVTALQRLFDLTPIHLRSPDCPVFRTYDPYSPPKTHRAHIALTADTFVRRFRIALRSAGHHDPDSFSGQGFRRSGTTFMLRSGVPAEVVRHHGRWSPTSTTFQRYLAEAAAWDATSLHRPT